MLTCFTYMVRYAPLESWWNQCSRLDILIIIIHTWCCWIESSVLLYRCYRVNCMFWICFDCTFLWVRFVIPVCIVVSKNTPLRHLFMYLFQVWNLYCCVLRDSPTHWLQVWNLFMLALVYAFGWLFHWHGFHTSLSFRIFQNIWKKYIYLRTYRTSLCKYTRKTIHSLTAKIFQVQCY